MNSSREVSPGKSLHAVRGKDWKAIRERVGMPEVIPYALRHSSLVRGLRKGLPIQQVAKLHNTSVKMIERHYAKYIVTALEDLVRAAVVPLMPRRADGKTGVRDNLRS